MKNNTEKKDTVLSDDIYKKIKKSKILIFAMISLLCGIFLNFPVTETTSMLNTKIMDSILMCLNSYEKKEKSWTEMIFLKPNVNGECYGKPNHSIAFDKISLGLSRPGLFPPGLRFYLSLEKKKTFISVFPLISPFGLTFAIKDTRIDSGLLNDFLDGPLIQGNFSFKSIMNSSWSKLEDGDIHIVSKNLTIPSQNISGFQIPDISIGNFILQGVFQKNTLNVKNLAVGNSSSTLQAEITGDIKINKFNITVSKLNITGKIRFSESFLESFPLVRFMLKTKDSNGFYKFNIKGTANSPETVFL